MSAPSYTRLPVEERRRQLLDRAVELFARHSYDELSMAEIARRSGISKGLLYHYFPGKRELFEATLRQAAEEVRELTDPDPDQPPLEALRGSVEAYLGWIEAHELAYTKLIRSAGAVGEVRALIDEVRGRTAERILAGLGFPQPPPSKVRIVVGGWLWMMDGAILDWLEHRDLERAELADLLIGILARALAASDGEG